jgi:coronin-1B/1C/6
LEVLFLCGKGDGNIRYFEFLDGGLHHYNNDFQSNIPGRGYGMLPKYCCDPMK